MIRDQYLRQLWELLEPVPEKLRREWLYDYEEHFRIAAEDGRSEEAAASELGDPRLIAKELLLSYRVEQAEDKNGSITSVTRAVIAAVSLGFFNLVFVLGPFIGLLGILIALWAVSLSLGLGAIAAAYEGLNGEVFTLAQGGFAASLLLALAMLLGAGTHALTRFVSKITLQYLKFNSRVIGVKKR